MSVPLPLKRIADFERLGFGMFVHWGLYSQLGQGEWIMNIAKIPKEEYKKLAVSFDPEKYDAAKWVEIAKAAGAKYITLTARHHDGFSLYDTRGLCDYDAPHYTGRDLVKEFVDACNAGGIVPMFYHTTLDWYQDSFENDFGSYLEYLRASVEVLCTNYGKIGGMWFDGNWSRPKGTDWHEDELYATIRRHQPDAIIVNNTGLSALGELGHPEIDSVTFEQGRPDPPDREGQKKYVAAETCLTMNDHWGYAKNDLHYKSLPELIETLCACRKVGANLLLNVGPTGEGEIAPVQEAMMRDLGIWVRTCGECIYDGRPSEIKAAQTKDFALEAHGNAYLFIHDLSIFGDSHVTVSSRGPGPKRFENVHRKVRSVSWTDNSERLSFARDGGSLTVEATGYPYATNYVVRVARVEFED